MTNISPSMEELIRAFEILSKEDNCGMKPEVLDTVIAVEDYLPQKNSRLDKEEA